MVRFADADILLLDEVHPLATADGLRTALAGLTESSGDDWNIDYGKSGGRQRGVIASRFPLEALPEFSSILPYSDVARARIDETMSPAARANPGYSMDGGIPVNGAVVLIEGRRLLLVIADLQCCGDDADSWQEFRRRIEADEIAKLVRRVLERTPVDAMMVAGDFNVVNTVAPLNLLKGPYGTPSVELTAAEAHHLGKASAETWTWDGRGTPFPSGVLDFQLYTPETLQVREAYVFDTEDLSPDVLKNHSLQEGDSKKMSEHRPIVVEFAWR